MADRFDLTEIAGWAAEGGAIARRYFNHVTAQQKPDHSLVTIADLTIERLLVDRITARYPQHGIIGEEQSRRAGDGEYLWAIDPLDGTAAFVAGLPLWCVSIGLLRHGQPLLGVIYVPLLEDTYAAGPGTGALLNGQPIAVLPPGAAPSSDWLAVPSDIHRYQVNLRVKLRSIGSTAASICYVARGSAAGALVSRASIWDLAAALAILSAAGGTSAYLADGAPLDLTALSDGRETSGPTLYAAADRVAALRDGLTRA